MLETWKLSMLRDLHRLMLRMHLLSVKMYPRRGLSTLQQWQLLEPRKALDYVRMNGVSR
jgi:hypothetical protein